MLKFKFLLPVAALMMMAVGCSDEDIVNPGNPDDGDGVTDPTVDRSMDKDKEKTLINDNVAFIMSVIDNSKSIFAYEQKEDGSYVVEFSDGTKNTVTVGQSTKVVHPKLTIDENNNWVIEGKKYDYKASTEEGEKNAYPIFNLRKSDDDYYWQVRFSDDKDAYIDVVNTENKALLANPLVEGDAANSSIISNISTENNVFSFKLQDKAMTKPLSQLGLKLVIKWENGDLDAQGYLNINGGEFKEVSLEYPDGNIVSAESSDEMKWLAEVSDRKLKITSLINNNEEGTVTVKVSNTIGGEIAEVIKVKTNYVVTKDTYYKQFYTDGKELTIGGIVLKKTGDNTVTIDGKTVNDIKIEKIDKAKTITEGGIYFIEPEVTGLKINVTSGEYLVVIGNDLEEYSKFDFAGGLTLGASNKKFLCKNIYLNGPKGNNQSNNLILKSNKDNVVFDGCYFKTAGTAALHFCAINNADYKFSIGKMQFEGCKFDLSAAPLSLFVIGGNETSMNVELRNNIFYSQAGCTAFKITAGQKKSSKSKYVLENNIFNNVYVANTGIINGDLSSVTVKNNIFHSDKAGTIYLLKAKNDQSPDAANWFSTLGGGASKNIASGPATWKLQGGANTPGTNFEEITNITASPFESFNFTDGTYVLKSDYSQYGPQK